jgi:uncharacterized membrane protein
LNRIARIFIAGLFALLPIVVTVFVTAWIAKFLHDWAGPDSTVGRFLISMGLNLSTSAAMAYILGLVILVIGIFVLGLIVESSLRPWFYGVFDGILRRIPLVSNVYDLSKRFVSIVDRRSGDDIKSMSPVWCFFGGDGGAAVLALMPSPQPVMVGAQEYLAILVPSAPVPIGGCLIYVPAEWIKPAAGGVEHLMSVYVSMGVTPPDSVAVGSKAILPPSGRSV